MRPNKKRWPPEANLWQLFNKAPVAELWDLQMRYPQVCLDLKYHLANNPKLTALEPFPKAFRKKSGSKTVWGELDLVTIYPGLTAGLGYSHASGKSEDEFKIGFSFDYTTGLPVIPGSSVKGKLRSFFPGRYKDSAKKAEVQEVLIDTLQMLNLLPTNKGSEAKVLASWLIDLETIIFEGKKDGDRVLSPLVQDAFFDAFPIETSDLSGKFLGEDTLAPHPHPLRDPVPLRFLKILPDVTMRFPFRLNNEGGLDAAQKFTLFQHLLQWGGAGAKTNPGYGQFKRSETPQLPDFINPNSNFEDGLIDLPLPIRHFREFEEHIENILLPSVMEDLTIPENYKGKLNKDAKFRAIVLPKGKTAMVQVTIADKTYAVELTGGSNLSADTPITVKINQNADVKEGKLLRVGLVEIIRSK